MKRLDLKGRTFGHLTVLREEGRTPHGNVTWRCRCVCGKSIVVTSGNLRQGQSSCGCAVKTRDGRSGTPEYEVWRAMIARCADATDETYGGRGIKVCQRWRDSFEAFLADVGPRPTGRNGKRAAYSLDRFPRRDGNYEPGNVRWATWKEQENNRGNNRRVLFDAMELTLAEWEARTGIGRKTIAYRLDHDWSIAEALSRKPHPGLACGAGR
jgi:hypothetical protein